MTNLMSLMFLFAEKYCKNMSYTTRGPYTIRGPDTCRTDFRVMGADFGNFLLLFLQHFHPGKPQHKLLKNQNIVSSIVFHYSLVFQEVCALTS